MTNNYPDISKFIAACWPGPNRSPTLDGCLNVLPDLTCPDLAEIQNTFGNAAGYPLTTTCPKIASALQSISKGDGKAVDVKALWDWYQTTLSPCLAQQCTAAGTPISAQELQQAPEILLKNAIDARLNPVEKFLLKYWKIIFISLLLIILVLILWLIIKKPKERTYIVGPSPQMMLAS